MNIQHLRHSLKVKWLLYYRQNRPWLVRLQIWGNYDGQRRPSSSFILATLSILEPQLTQMFPFIVSLSNNPDQIVAALGLNFEPDVELKSMTEASPVAETNANGNGLSKQVDFVSGQWSVVSGQEMYQEMSIPHASFARQSKGGVNPPSSGLESKATPPSSTRGTRGPLWGLGAEGIKPELETTDNEQLTTDVRSGEVNLSPSTQASNLASWVDESCSGKGSLNAGLALSLLAVIGTLAVMFVSFSG